VVNVVVPPDVDVGERTGFSVLVPEVGMALAVQGPSWGEIVTADDHREKRRHLN
jgi:hypothetical protein